MPSRLTLKDRRLMARGISPRIARFWDRRVFLPPKGTAGANGVVGNRAALSIGTGNSKLLAYAKAPGTGGNAITLALVVGGTVPVIAVAGNAITATAPVATTAIQMARAIRGDFNAGKLIHIGTVTGSDGSAAFTPTAATALAGATAAL